MTTTTTPSRRTRSPRPAAEVLEPMGAGQAVVYQRLRAHLAFLRLGAAAEALTAVLDAARAQDLSVIDAMEQLLAVEVHATEVRRLTGRLRFACLPHSWTLPDYDLAAQPGVDAKLITELATLRFLEDAGNVLLIGPPVIEANRNHRFSVHNDTTLV